MANIRGINDTREPADEATPLIAPLAGKQRQRKVVVEPVIFIISMCWKGSIPITQFYLTDRFTSQNTFLSNSSNEKNRTEGSMKCSDNRSDLWYIATQGVQEQTSQWILYLNIITFGIVLLVLPFYGAYSDVAGRRIMLVVSCTGLALHFVVNTLVIFLNLEPWILLIGAAIEGLCGSFKLGLLAAWAYLADTNREDQRAFRFVLTEVCNGLASGVAQIGLGEWTKQMGLLPPSIFLTGSLILCLIYVIFFIPEPRVVRKDRQPVCSYLTGMVKLYFKPDSDTDGQRRHWAQLPLILLTLFFYFMPLTSKTQLITLFTTDPPLCWGAILVSFSYGVIYTTENLGAVIAVTTFKKLGLTEVGIAVISLISAIPFFTLLAFSWNTTMVFIACGLTLCCNVAYSMILAIISNGCKAYQQGSAMAGLIWVDTFSTVFGSFVLNEIYEVTLFFMNGLVFLVCTGMIGISLIVFISATIIIKLPQVPNPRYNGLE